MRPCPNCGQLNPLDAPACQRCGAALFPTAAGVSGVAAPPPPPYPPTPQPAPEPPPAFVPRAPMPPPPPVLPYQHKTFTWMDVCTVLGFVASIVGYFYTSLVLLPLGLVSSALGFRGDRTRGLAVAGIVLSLIGLLIRLMIVLSDTGILPYWVTNGVW